MIISFKDFIQSSSFFYIYFKHNGFWNVHKKRCQYSLISFFYSLNAVFNLKKRVVFFSLQQYNSKRNSFSLKLTWYRTLYCKDVLISYFAQKTHLISFFDSVCIQNLPHFFDNNTSFVRVKNVFYFTTGSYLWSPLKVYNIEWRALFDRPVHAPQPGIPPQHLPIMIKMFFVVFLCTVPYNNKRNFFFLRAWVLWNVDPNIWYGSGDPCLWPMDPDPVRDPTIFVLDLQDANKKLFFSKFFCFLLFEGTFKSFFYDKTSQGSHKTELPYLPMTNRSGSRRPKPNTGDKDEKLTLRLEPRQRIISAFSAARLAPFQLIGQAMEPRSPKWTMVSRRPEPQM